MAIPATVDYENLKCLLSNLLNTDNTIRSNAEELYEKLPVVDKNFLLLNAINDNTLRIEEIELAAVLYRRYITTHFDEVFVKLEPHFSEEIQSQLLSRVQQNISPNLRKKVGDAAAELARHYVDENGTNHWPKYLNFLFEGASSADPVAREVVLLMFAASPGVFGNQQAKYISVIYQMLTVTLSSVQPDQVRYAAVKAFTAFMITNEKDIQVQKQFVGCINLILEFLDKTMESKNGEDEPDEILRNLVDVAEACPQYFRGQVDDVFGICLKGMSDTENTESTRQLSLEMIVTLCEAAPAMIRKVGSKHLLSIIMWTLKMMTELDDDPNWSYVDDETEDEDNDSNPSVAEAALDRFACSLGGKVLLPLVMHVLQEMLNSGNWNERYAGLMAISAIGEGCHKQMSAILPKVVDGVLPFLFDTLHPRVRYGACNAIGQMSTDFAPVFQKKFHDKVIQALLQLLGDPSSPRVQAHAGAALVNFFEDCPKHILSPYMNTIILQLEKVLTAKLTELAEKGTKLVLEQVVVTLASLADSSQEKFIEYYDKFMPCLKFIIQNANQPNLLMLRGKAIECVSLIGLAVGRDKFLSDANEVMDLLLKNQAGLTSLSDDDPQLSYMITAWARICKILGKEFKPYLQYVMEPVLKAASFKPEIALIDTDDIKVVDDDDWQFVNLGEKHNFGIKTAGLEDKATACSMLVCYAKELKEGFSQYVDETLELMIPLLKFYFHDGVRMAASEIMPYLLDISIKTKGDAYVQAKWPLMLQALLQVLDSEPEADVLCEHLAALSQCIETLNKHCLTEADINILINLLAKHLESHFTHCTERENSKKEEDYDEATEEDLLKLDDDYYFILSKVSELICTIFGIYKQEFFPYFETLLPFYAKLLEPKRNWQDRQWSLCVFADIIEYCGPDCSKYVDIFLQPTLDSITDESADLRQTATYTVGALALHGGPNFARFCAETALPRLISLINSPDSRSEENERATENAISAITKIFMSNNPQVNPEEIIPGWITWLPIWEDEDEVKYVFNVLCSLLESNNTALLGADNMNLPRIVHIFADAFLREALEPHPEVKDRVLRLVSDIQKNPELFSVCVTELALPELQAALLGALQQYNK